MGFLPSRPGFGDQSNSGASEQGSTKAAVVPRFSFWPSCSLPLGGKGGRWQVDGWKRRHLSLHVPYSLSPSYGVQ